MSLRYSLRHTDRDELSKLKILEFLSNPQDAGFLGGADLGVTKEDMRILRVASSLDRRLAEMTQAGLVTRDETSSASKPYTITDEGRRHLEEARQKAMLLIPSQRLGWSDAAEGIGHKAVAEFIRCLPEFKESSERRIQMVTKALVEAMGLPAPPTDRSDTERSGR